MLTLRCFIFDIFPILTLITSTAKSLGIINPVSVLTLQSILLLSLDSISWWLSTDTPQVSNSGVLNLWKIFIVNFWSLIIARFTSNPPFLLLSYWLILHRFWFFRKKRFSNLRIRVDLWRILWYFLRLFRLIRNILSHVFFSGIRIGEFHLLLHDCIN